MTWVIIDANDLNYKDDFENGTLVTLECEDMEVLHDALGFHGELIQKLARANAGIDEPSSPISEYLQAITESEARPDDVSLEELNVALQGTFALDHMRVKKLRAGLVELAGEDLTGRGCNDD